MKKQTVIFLIPILVMLSAIVSFGQQNKKVTDAKKKVAKAQQKLTEARKDSAADFQKFKTYAYKQIDENQKKIDALRAKRMDDTKENKDKYDKKVSDLEQKNEALRAKIEGADTIQTTGWAAFKREFNHDLDEFGQAFKDVGVNNTK